MSKPIRAAQRANGAISMSTLEDEKYVWDVPETDWRPASGQYTKCRAYGCPHQPIAEVNRGRRSWDTGRRTDSWWAYCAEHMYGRKLIDGVVYGWRRRAG